MLCGRFRRLGSYQLWKIVQGFIAFDVWRSDISLTYTPAGHSERTCNLEVMAMLFLIIVEIEHVNLNRVTNVVVKYFKRKPNDIFPAGRLDYWISSEYNITVKYFKRKQKRHFSSRKVSGLTTSVEEINCHLGTDAFTYHSLSLSNDSFVLELYFHLREHNRIVCLLVVVPDS